MGKYLKDWVKHPAMAMSIEQRELMMMLYRDVFQSAERFCGMHVAEAALIAAGYAVIQGDVLRMTDQGIEFWEGYIMARGDVMPLGLRGGFHQKG